MPELKSTCLRDLTRGGLATTLNEIVCERNVCVNLEEALIPVDEVVQSACEILGLDPLYIPNEGRFAVFVPASACRCGTQRSEEN